MSEQPPARVRSPLSKIFMSSDEPRLRAGWRLLMQSILLVILLVITSDLISLKPVLDLNIRLREFAEFCAFYVSVYLARRFLDRRSFVSLGFKMDRYALFDLVAGMLITFFMIGFMFIVMLTLGWLKFDSFAWETDSGQVMASQILPFFIIFVLIGFNEELLWRGYWLQTLASGRNLFWGVILSSVIFGYLHAGNPNASWVTVIGDMLFGVFVALGYVRTKQLWLSVGLHIGYNFFDSNVFGFPVTGWQLYSLIHIRVLGPGILTGGVFGPEAGLIVLPAYALGAALMYFYTRQRRPVDTHG